MVPHLVYEIEQLQEMTALIQSNTYPTSGGSKRDRIVGQALFEASIIHARLLDEFFYANNRRPDDVNAFEDGRSQAPE